MGLMAARHMMQLVCLEASGPSLDFYEGLRFKTTVFSSLGGQRKKTKTKTFQKNIQGGHTEVGLWGQ